MKPPENGWQKISDPQSSKTARIPDSLDSYYCELNSGGALCELLRATDCYNCTQRLVAFWIETSYSGIILGSFDQVFEPGALSI
jgi:hypothetical protein